MYKIGTRPGRRFGFGVKKTSQQAANLAVSNFGPRFKARKEVMDDCRNAERIVQTFACAGRRT